MIRVTTLLLLIVVTTVTFSSNKDIYDLVILNGRVIDPESKTDAVRNLGITGGKIKSISRRDDHALSLLDALTKMTLLPAQRLERRVHAMKNKGRIRVAADADLTIFDPQTISDRSTFQDPAQLSAGVRFVIVNGILLVKDGQLQANVHPGVAIRAPF